MYVLQRTVAVDRLLGGPGGEIDQEKKEKRKEKKVNISNFPSHFPV